MNVNVLLKASLVSLFAFAGTASAGDDPKVAAEVIAAAKAQWAAEIASKSVAEQMATVADEYTEFNPQYPVRLDGKAANASLSEGALKGGGGTVSAEMMNPKVQVYGDVAILTYSYAGVNQAKDGKTETSAGKSTRVYVKEGGQWKLVHAHFSAVDVPKN
jgi:ketosteroid isomerase-like protein